jgi:hypothetical protein
MVGEGGNPTNTVDGVRFNRIFNNQIFNCGREYYGAVGVWLGLTEGTVLSHNYIHNLPYTGISAGWRWDSYPTACSSNVVEFNQVDHVMQLLGDGAGIYTLGNQRGSVLRGNVVQNSRSGGLYFDEGSNGWLVESNYVNNCRTKIIFNSGKEAEQWNGNFIDFPRIGPGKFGKCFVGDGTSSCFIVPSSLALDPSEITVEAWVKFPRYGEGGYVVGKNGNNCTDGHYGLYLKDKTFGAIVNIGGGCGGNNYDIVAPAGSLGPKQWYLLSMTYDGQTLKLYQDGSLVGSQNINKPRSPGAGIFTIGVRSDKYSYLLADIDEVRVYKRALTGPELKEQFHATAPPPFGENAPDLVGYWGFDEYSDQPPGLDLVIKNAGLAKATPQP